MSNIVKFLSASMLFMSGAIWANAHATSTPAHLHLCNGDRKHNISVEVQKRHHNYGRRNLSSGQCTDYTLNVEPVAGKYKVLAFNRKGYRLTRMHVHLYPGEVKALSYKKR